MEEKFTHVDFGALWSNFWECRFDEAGCHISNIVNGKTQDVFVDCAWSLLFHKEGDALAEAKMAFVRRNVPRFFGGKRMSCLRFAEKSIEIFVDVGGQPLQCDAIQRLSFYARTDVGTMVVTINPTFSKDARPVTVLISRRAKYNATLQALAAGWFYEIFSQN